MSLTNRAQRCSGGNFGMNLRKISAQVGHEHRQYEVTNELS